MKLNVKEINVLIIIVILLIINIGTAKAQTVDISGNWEIKNQQNISGKLYSNGVPKELSIAQNSNIISIRKIFTGDSGDISISEVGNLSGKPFETRTASNKKKVVTMIRDKSNNSFSEITDIYDATDSSKLEHVSTDIWSLLGSELALDHRDHNVANNESWEEKATYRKQ